MKIKYVDKTFQRKSLALIDYCNDIIANYQAQGFRLTLRQLYYQLVARDRIPNRQNEYDKLGSTLNDARLAGLVDWEAIEDRTRNVNRNAHWDSPRDIIHQVAKGYRRDLWASQTYRPEVWVEKDALEGVIESVCRPFDVPFFSCRGYTSQTAMWEAGNRLLEYRDQDQIPIIIHLGDHDPSGIDMSRDIEDRLSLFYGEQVTFERIALNEDQVKQYNPPPNPAKQSDSRFSAYNAEYGDQSWELDALEPSVLVALIREKLVDILDRDPWQAAKLEQETERQELYAIYNHYSKARKAIAKFIEEPEITEE